MSARIASPAFRDRVCTAAEAAALIAPGATLAVSGFTGAGYPKAVPLALAERIRSEGFAVSILSGASTGPELDGALAKAGGMARRLPYQSDPITRAAINAGTVEYLDLHLSQVAQMARAGYFGRIDCAVVEVAAIRSNGLLLPSTSIGNSNAWLDLADRVILEVNHALPLGLDGMHDVPAPLPLPPRPAIAMERADQRIGSPYLSVDPTKVVAVVETNLADRPMVFDPPDSTSEAIAQHLLEFLRHEIQHGRLPPTLPPLQSGVGNIANAVLKALADGGFRDLHAYTEVLQDNLLYLLRDGVFRHASASALAFSCEALADFEARIDFYRPRILLRPQEVSNFPELIRRLGVIAMNGMLEADIYGNVNSTHVAGSRIMNGIGGSADFARNAAVSMFLSPSTAKHGAVSAIVPMVSHVDHTEHDVQIIITEQGVADLRGLPPRRRADRIIARCAHPSYRDALADYLARAMRDGGGQHTPHLLDEALSWHARWQRSGDMRR